MTLALPIPEVPPAVYVAVAVPSTKFVAAEIVPNVAFQVAVKVGRPFNSVVKAPPVFLCLMSAVNEDVWPLQSSVEVALSLSCK